MRLLSTIRDPPVDSSSPDPTPSHIQVTNSQSDHSLEQCTRHAGRQRGRTVKGSTLTPNIHPTMSQHLAIIPTTMRLFEPVSPLSSQLPLLSEVFPKPANHVQHPARPRTAWTQQPCASSLSLSP
jgi:hypothetical protein